MTSRLHVPAASPTVRPAAPSQPPPAPHRVAGPPRSHGWAFDRRRHNRRPAFSLHQTLQRRPEGGWWSRREWRAVGPELVAAETIVWHGGLRESVGEQPSLGEVTRATVIGDACRCVLRSPRTGGADRERRLVLPHPAVTLASLPLFIAQHWDELVQGARLPASYLVLKVQRAATVRLQRATLPDGQGLAIDAIPAHPILRAIFGRTRCVFDADAPRLRRIDGLLDPRDLRPNGRWHEYLGSIEFEQPLDLSGLAVPGDAR